MRKVRTFYVDFDTNWILLKTDLSTYIHTELCIYNKKNFDWSTDLFARLTRCNDNDITGVTGGAGKHWTVFSLCPTLD